MGISISTITRWCSQGKIEAIPKAYGRKVSYHIPMSQIEALLAEGKEKEARQLAFWRFVEQGNKRLVESMIDYEKSLSTESRQPVSSTETQLAESVSRYEAVVAKLKSASEPVVVSSALKNPLPVTDIQEADHQPFVESWLQAMRSGMMPGTSKPFSERTIEDYRSYVQPFISQYQFLSLDNLVFYIGQYPPEKYATRDKCYKALVCFAKYLVFKKQLPEVFLKEAKKFRQSANPNPTRKTITEADLKAFVMACQDISETLLVGLLINTGLRASEAADLKWEDVNIDESKILVRKGKGNKVRTVAIPDDFKPVIQEYKETLSKPQQKAFVLWNASGKPMTRHSLGKKLKGIGNRVGVQTANPHAFRRGFVTLNSERGVPLVFLKMACGHSNSSTTELYCRPDEQQYLEKGKAWCLT